MTLQTFFDVASPATLASMVADVQTLGKGASASARGMEVEARRQLDALVGADEAARLIDAAYSRADLVDLAEKPGEWTAEEIQRREG